MTKENAKKVIEEISNKYFYDDCISSGSPFFNIIAIKGLTTDEVRELGEALVSITDE